MQDAENARLTPLAVWMREKGIRRGVARGLIARGLLRATQPGGKGSGWYIPTEAAERFLADLEGKK